MDDSSRGSAVLVMAPERGPSDEPSPLEAVLGAERWAALQELLLARLIAWGEEVTPGAVRVLPGDEAAGAEDGGDMSRRLARAVEAAFGDGNAHVLIAWPDLITWRPDHASGALSDLADGCGISVGPVFDGGFYLIALARPLPQLFELPPETWRSADGMMLAFGAAHEAGVEVGLLRAERGLHSPEDMRAALADPLLDPELRVLLAGSA